MYGENYCIFIRESSGSTYSELQCKSLLIRRELEKRLQTAELLKTHGRIQFQVGCCELDPHLEDTQAAVETAFHFAHGIATKKLPFYFSAFRSQLHEILAEELISVLAQPIVSLKTGDVFGWEILARGPTNTAFHSPLDLFEFAYQADLLSKTEFLVIRQAFREIAKKHIKEQVFINVTAVTLCHPLLLNHVLDLLKEYPQIQPSQIVFEITERHGIKDFAHMGKILAAYRARGIRFAVDDAGAGYSSLQSISELIPDIIKIDKSLIQNIDQFSVKRSMLKALLSFAQDISCQVVAEGIEREEEADILFEHKVDMGQGFYFARPEPLVLDFEKAQESVKSKIKQHQEKTSFSA